MYDEDKIIGLIILCIVLFFVGLFIGNWGGQHDLASGVCEHNGMMLADYNPTNGTIRCIRTYDVVNMNNIKMDDTND